MAKKKKQCYSGIGGQAVLEGIMMKNRDKYAIAVRKPDGEITVAFDEYQGMLKGSKIKEIPFIRGIFNFLDSLILGMKCLNFSASFYEEEEQETAFDRTLNKITKGKAESVISGIVTCFSVVLAIGLFVVLPYIISSLLDNYILNVSLLAIIEGLIRILIFILYVWGISAMKDIRRLYMYHGAEHKCINCLERGRELNVKNVKRSSRLHKRCGTSFMFFVLFVSIILFFFIRVDNTIYKILLRIALMPVVAGISYEIIRLAGRSNNIFVKILSAPGMLIQRMTTREPDESMIRVAIAAVEAVYDWKAFLNENFEFEYEIDGEVSKEEQDGDEDIAVREHVNEDVFAAEDYIDEEEFAAKEESEVAEQTVSEAQSDDKKELS